MGGGHRVQPGTKLFAREPTQVPLDAPAKVCVAGRRDDRTCAVTDKAAAGRVDGANHDRLAAQHHGGSVNPGVRDVRGSHPRLFLRDPLGVLLEKTRRLEARATPRHGHADAAVGPHPNDVPACTAHPDEVDRAQRPGRFGRRSAKEWEIELHGWCGPMITQAPRALSRQGDQQDQLTADSAQGILGGRVNITETARVLDALRRETERIGFSMVSEPKTGSLLRTLAASKPGGRFLELGTGTGVGTAWLLAGMDARSHLDSVDTDATVQEIARRHLGHDDRVTFHVADGAAFLEQSRPQQFDLIYADAWPGKFSHLEVALSLLRIGGLYLVDDLMPQANWPEGHAPKVRLLIEQLEARHGFVSTKLDWASGLMILVRTDPA